MGDNLESAATAAAFTTLAAPAAFAAPTAVIPPSTISSLAAVEWFKVEVGDAILFIGRRHVGAGTAATTTATGSPTATTAAGTTAAAAATAATTAAGRELERVDRNIGRAFARICRVAVFPIFAWSAGRAIFTVAAVDKFARWSVVGLGVSATTAYPTIAAVPSETSITEEATRAAPSGQATIDTVLSLATETSLIARITLKAILGLVVSVLTSFAFVVLAVIFAFFQANFTELRDAPDTTERFVVVAVPRFTTIEASITAVATLTTEAASRTRQAAISSEIKHDVVTNQHVVGNVEADRSGTIANDLDQAIVGDQKIASKMESGNSSIADQGSVKRCSVESSTARHAVERQIASVDVQLRCERLHGVDRSQAYRSGHLLPREDDVVHDKGLVCRDIDTIDFGPRAKTQPVDVGKACRQTKRCKTRSSFDSIVCFAHRRVADERLQRDEPLLVDAEHIQRANGKGLRRRTPQRSQSADLRCWTIRLDHRRDRRRRFQDQVVFLIRRAADREPSEIDSRFKHFQVCRNEAADQLRFTLQLQRRSDKASTGLEFGRFDQQGIPRTRANQMNSVDECSIDNRHVRRRIIDG